MFIFLWIDLLYRILIYLKLARHEEVEVDVTKDDQQRINQFSCRTTVLHEHEAELIRLAVNPTCDFIFTYP